MSNRFKVASPVGDFIRRCRDIEIKAPGVSWEIVGNERRVIGGGQNRGVTHWYCKIRYPQNVVGVAMCAYYQVWECAGKVKWLVRV